MSTRELENDQPSRQISLVGHGLSGWLTEDGHIGTTRVTATFDDIPGPFLYEVEAEFIAGTDIAATKPQITTLVISPKEPDDAAPIRRTELKAIPIQLLLDRVRGAVSAHFATEGAHAASVGTLAENMSLHRPKNGRQLSDEHYIHLTWWYCYFQLAGRPPRKALAEKYDRHPVTVSRWVAEARRRGYLPPYEPVRRESQMEATRAWNKSFEVQERQMANRALARQMTEQVSADLDRSIVDDEAGRDLMGAFIKSLCDGSDDLSQDARTLVTIKVLEEIAESDSGALSEAARDFLAQLNDFINDQG